MSMQHALSNWEMESDFVLGQKDKEQLKISRGSNLSFLEGNSFLVNFNLKENDLCNYYMNITKLILITGM